MVPCWPGPSYCRAENSCTFCVSSEMGQSQRPVLAYIPSLPFLSRPLLSSGLLVSPSSAARSCSLMDLVWLLGGREKRGLGKREQGE